MQMKLNEFIFVGCIIGIHYHTALAAIENVNTIDERRSRIARNNWPQMAIENAVSIDFDLCLLIVKSIFDYRLPGKIMGPSRCYGLIVVMATAIKQKFKYNQKCLLF